MRSSVRLLASALLAAAWTGVPAPGLRAAPVAPTLVYAPQREAGLASWYGEEAAGSPTASGSAFDPAAITAAHRTLPLGSIVEVTALATGRAILVRITDRGPGRLDRLIDLSRGAAQLLGTDRDPLAPVRVRAVALAPERLAALRSGHGLVTSAGQMPAGSVAPAVHRARAYMLRVASFSNGLRARRLAATLGGRVERAPGLFRVDLGPYADAGAAQRARDAVATRGYGDASLLPVNH